MRHTDLALRNARRSIRSRCLPSDRHDMRRLASVPWAGNFVRRVFGGAVCRAQVQEQLGALTTAFSTSAQLTQTTLPVAPAREINPNSPAVATGHCCATGKSQIVGEYLWLTATTDPGARDHTWPPSPARSPPASTPSVLYRATWPASARSTITN